MSAERQFTSWRRDGLVAAVAGTPAAGRARADLTATIALAGSARRSPIPVELAGPGDVAGVPSDQIARCDPFDGCPDFEPEYFPYVELVNPALPWLFSPAGPSTAPLPNPEAVPVPPGPQRRLRPWLALVTVPVEAATVTAGGNGRPPVLSCPGAELPDPEESWAWAHVDGGGTGTAVSRLLSPRRLVAGRAYQSFLVPAFAAGLDPAGLPHPGAGPLDPAWRRDGTAQLPVYFTFRFATGAAGTFEELARRLRPRAAPEATTGRVVATDAPGWGVVGPAGSTVVVPGALRPVKTAAADPLPPGLAARLAAAISATGPGPQLRPPLYGQDYAGGATAVDAAGAGWLPELNTDPRHRLAAGLGAWAVAVNQDSLSDRAWTQLAAAGIQPAASTDPELGDAMRPVLAARADAGPVAVLAPALARLARAAGPRAAAVPGMPAPPAPAAPARRFAPTFDEPAFTLLRAVAPEWLLPGAGDIPDESVVALSTDQSFAEAFLVGLNHALARELQWRRYPLDTTGTMFHRFWAAAPGAADPTVGEIAGWHDTALGSHGPAPDNLVLLVRGALLRRFPTASIYLSGFRPADGAEVRMAPVVAGRLAAGTSFFGFPITPETALNPAGADGITGWKVVIEEGVDHPRFGLDPAPADGGTAPVDGWRDLDWGHPQVAAAAYVPVAGPLAGLTRPLTTRPGPALAVRLTWGADSAELAMILTRPA
ncbi:hypothetical protein, partial [Actinoplanes nipponensis]